MKKTIFVLIPVFLFTLSICVAQTGGRIEQPDPVTANQDNICNSEALLKQMRASYFGASVLEAGQSVEAAVTPQVRMIYLVPSDVEPRQDYQAAMANAITHLQKWYQEQLLSAKTFLLHNPAVEIVRSTHNSRWFTRNSNGDNPSLNLWFNSIAEASAKFNDPNFIYLIYVDVDAAGQSVGGTSGVALLHRNDLLVLAGQHPTETNVCRSVGGLGHELGHALGLPHPPECDSHQAGDDSFACQSLMYLGYLNYPDTYLISEHKSFLNQSAFFGPVELSGLTPDCSNLLPSATITSASFDGKKKLIINGSNFSINPKVIINEKDRSNRITDVTGDEITLKSKAKKLGLVTGENTIKVIGPNGVATNVFLLRL